MYNKVPLRRGLICCCIRGLNFLFIQEDHMDLGLNSCLATLNFSFLNPGFFSQPLDNGGIFLLILDVF